MPVTTFDDPRVKRVLDSRTVATLATIQPTGAPLAVAMWFVHDDDGRLESARHDRHVLGLAGPDVGAGLDPPHRQHAAPAHAETGGVRERREFFEMGVDLGLGLIGVHHADEIGETALGIVVRDGI